MFCAECGTKNEVSSKYCKNCGALLVSNDGILGDIPDNVLPKENMLQSSDMNMPVIKTKMSGWSVAFIVEIILLAVLAYGLKLIGDKYYGPEHVAERYFETIMEGDLKEAYDFLDVEESKFISKEFFNKAYTSESRGKISSFSTRLKSVDDVYATAEVTYRVSNEKDKRTQEISLIKKGSKKFFLFNDWKVQPDEVILDDVVVYAPKEATVKVDGISLGKELKRGEEGIYDVYNIPELFRGNHRLSAEREGAQQAVINVFISDEWNIDEETAVWLPHLYLQKEVLQKVSENSKSVFKSIMDARVKDSKAGFISDLVADEEGAVYTKYHYTNFISANKDYFRLDNIEVETVDFDAESYAGFSSDTCQTVATSELRCDCIYNNSYGYDEGYGEIYAKFYYGYIGGKLSLLAVELSSDDIW